MEHIAAELGLDPAEVKRRNFIARPDSIEPDPLAPSLAIAGSSGAKSSSFGADDAQAGGSTTAADGSGLLAFSIAADGTQEAAVRTQPQVADTSAAAAPHRPCFAGPAAGLTSDEQVEATIMCVCVPYKDVRCCAHACLDLKDARTCCSMAAALDVGRWCCAGAEHGAGAPLQGVAVHAAPHLGPDPGEI